MSGARHSSAVTETDYRLDTIDREIIRTTFGRSRIECDPICGSPAEGVVSVLPLCGVLLALGVVARAIVTSRESPLAEHTRAVKRDYRGLRSFVTDRACLATPRALASEP